MTNSALEFAEEHALGKVLERVRLDGDVLLPNGGRARATLLLTKSGLWLAAARDRFNGLKVDLLTRGDLRLESGRVRDRLCFERETLLIPAGRRSAVERLIALGRLASAGGERGADLKTSRLVHAPDELGRAWLGRELAIGETLVCWLHGSNTVSLASHLIGESQCEPYLFVTDRRAAVVAWSKVFDLTYSALDAGTLSQHAQGEKTELRGSKATFLSRRADAEATRDAFELIAIGEPKARLLEAARRLWLSRERERDDAARSLDLLHAAIESGSRRARFARLLALADRSEAASPLDRAELSRALSAGQLTPDGLAELWQRWQFSSDAAALLVRALLDLGEASLPFALALQRRSQETPSADEETARDQLRLAPFAVATRLASTTADPRDLELHDVLQVHGLARLETRVQPGATGLAPKPPAAALSPLLVETALSHPLARGQGSLVVGVQKLIALAPEPDQVALSDYCEALNPSEQPEASRALAAARLAFALPTLHAYVSRGKKSIGLRGYEGGTPYILLGKAHLDQASPYAMSEAELFFAFGAEALHLKLGLTRVTSSDVWAGAFAHTKGGVELLLGLLPFVKGIPLGAGVTKVLERIPEPALRKGLDALIRFERGQRKPARPGTTEGALSLVNENLVAAHRLMQMSADRAGLLLCGDLRSSLRGLLLVRPDYRSLLDAMEQRDLVSVL
ncbi:MAG TPA: hypothetical protein VK745_17715, partial [Polyangiaceae bacterium]|nr:hypothetical protein [Polyangiaceae bacterium]